MICKEIPKTMYCHIGGSGTWGCEFPEDLNMEGITLLKRIWNLKPRLESLPA